VESIETGGFIAFLRWRVNVCCFGGWTDQDIAPLTYKPKILEALAASGLRSVRYVKEIPDLEYVVCNDLDKEAVESIKRNTIYNDLSPEVLRPSLNDAKYAFLRLAFLLHLKCTRMLTL
jgi:tRNA G26 N,N-dimethylase Trm1